MGVEIGSEELEEEVEVVDEGLGNAYDEPLDSGVRLL